MLLTGVSERFVVPVLRPAWPQDAQTYRVENFPEEVCGIDPLDFPFKPLLLGRRGYPRKDFENLRLVIRTPIEDVMLLVVNLEGISGHLHLSSLFMKSYLMQPLSKIVVVQTLWP